MVYVLRATLGLPALIVAAQVVSLTWPTDFYVPYNSSGPLVKQGALKFDIGIPQFPAQVLQVAGPVLRVASSRLYLLCSVALQINLTGFYAPITTTFQCRGCGSGILNPCMTVYSGSGPNSPCDQKICDEKPHVCEEPLPTSTAAPGVYSLVIADENILKNISYTLTIQMGCANASRPLDKDVCAPVLAGNYPTACVFEAGDAAGNQTIFGVDGCDCVASASVNGCSLCWDGSVPAQCNVTGRVQDCGPYCPPPPRPAPRVS
jgi:hypothetical protein